MLERDYIMRLIRDFFDALEKLKEKSQKENKPTLQLEIKSMYRAYFTQSENFFYEQDINYILFYLETTFPSHELLQRVEILAELMYFDGSIQTEAEKKLLWSKSLALLLYLDTHSNTFSMERRNKIAKIKELID